MQFEVHIDCFRRIFNIEAPDWLIIVSIKIACVLCAMFGHALKLLCFFSYIVSV